MTRQITSNNYVAICAELIITFGKALEADEACWGAEPGGAEDTDDAAANNAAFDLATECGWDWEHDENFVSWANKATGQESLVEGLRHALDAARAQYLDYITRQEIRS